MRHLITATLLIVGIIHFLPFVGAFSTSKIFGLYGVAVSDPSAEILLRHRAVLFGLIGAILIAGAFTPSIQPAAFTIGVVSVTSFLYMAWLVGGYNAKLNKVVTVDLAALGLLVAGAIAYAAMRYANASTIST